MAVQTVQNLPAQFVQDLGQDLAKQVVAQSGVPVVATGIAGISQQPGESPEDFKIRQDAAQAFTTRQQNIAGLAPHSCCTRSITSTSTTSSTSRHRFFSTIFRQSTNTSNIS